MPILDHVRVNELDPDTEAGFISVLQVIESLDAAAYVALMAPDVEIVMDGARPACTAVTRCRPDWPRPGAGWSSLASLLHDEADIDGSGDRFAHETVTHAVTTDGQHIGTPGPAHPASSEAFTPRPSSADPPRFGPVADPPEDQPLRSGCSSPVLVTTPNPFPSGSDR